jgi:hypothetical protein
VSARAVVLVVAGALAASPPAAQAQAARFAGADATLSTVRFRGSVPGGDEMLSGLAVGAQARVDRDRATLEISYATGRLSASTGSAASRSLVEGSLAVVYRARPWLTLQAGPHLRAYVAPSGTERWVFWEARAHGESTIIPDVLVAHVEGWLAVISSVNVGPGAGGARGGEAGLTLRMRRWPVDLRLAYAVDRASLANDVRTETLEAVFLGITYHRK